MNVLCSYVYLEHFTLFLLHESSPSLLVPDQHNHKMLLESFVSVALAVIVSGAPATCPTSGTWLQGTDAKNNAVCCPSPVVTGGICSVALSDVGRGMITCGGKSNIRN